MIKHLQENNSLFLMTKIYIGHLMLIQSGSIYTKNSKPLNVKYKGNLFFL